MHVAVACSPFEAVHTGPASAGTCIVLSQLHNFHGETALPPNLVPYKAQKAAAVAGRDTDGAHDLFSLHPCRQNGQLAGTVLCHSNSPAAHTSCAQHAQHAHGV